MFRILVCGCILTVMTLGYLMAADASVGGQDGIAKCVKIEGAFLQRGKDGRFTAIKTGDSVPAERLLIGLPEAELLARGGKVKISLLLHVGDSVPVTESAIVLHDSPKIDADITLDRGVIRLQGTQEKGDVRVKIRGGSQVWELTLKDPDTTVLAVRFGRHEPGTKYLRTGPKKDLVDAPMMHFGLLIAKGHVDVNTGTAQYSLSAPPGPAMIAWDTNGGYEVKRLDKLPEQVRELDVKELKNYKEVCELTAKLVAGDLGKGLDQLLSSANPVQRVVGIACAGALDDLPRLWSCLENPNQPEVRDKAVILLRTWIGREPGQLTKLQEHLMNVKKYSATQTRTLLQLLKGFDDSDRAEPVLYQMLIDGLDHGSLPVREMAHWHLERLAPAGQKIVYDAGGAEALRHQAAEQWRQLIPPGKLPPPPPAKSDAGKKAA